MSSQSEDIRPFIITPSSCTDPFIINNILPNISFTSGSTGNIFTLSSNITWKSSYILTLNSGDSFNTSTGKPLSITIVSDGGNKNVFSYYNNSGLTSPPITTVNNINIIGGLLFGDYCVYCNINNCTSDGEINTGGIVGNTSTNCTINNCITRGIITNGGGIIGNGCRNCTISNCTSYGSITTGGGIIGNNCKAFTITNCCSYGSINSTSGGICGLTCSSTVTPSSCSITSCYSTGNISSNAGGICGSGCQNIPILYCYTTGSVEDNGGGMCGSSCTTITITSCLTTLGTQLDNNSGFLAQSSSGCTANNCYTTSNYSSFSGNGTLQSLIGSTCLIPSSPTTNIELSNLFSVIPYFYNFYNTIGSLNTTLPIYNILSGIRYNGGTYTLQSNLTIDCGYTISLYPNQIFEGNNYTLSIRYNFFWENGNGNGISYIGLFSTSGSSNSIIQNLYIDLNNIGHDGGGIVQSGSTNFTIQNCYVSSNTNQNPTHGQQNVGGICGSHCQNGTISYCQVNLNLGGSYNGGICGYQCAGMILNNNQFIGALNGTYSGGLLSGYNTSNINGLFQCYSLLTSVNTSTNANNDGYVSGSTGNYFLSCSCIGYTTFISSNYCYGCNYLNSSSVTNLTSTSSSTGSSLYYNKWSQQISNNGYGSPIDISYFIKNPSTYSTISNFITTSIFTGTGTVPISYDANNGIYNLLSDFTLTKTLNFVINLGDGETFNGHGFNVTIISPSKAGTVDGLFIINPFIKNKNTPLIKNLTIISSVGNYCGGIVCEFQSNVSVENCCHDGYLGTYAGGICGSHCSNISINGCLALNSSNNNNNPNSNVNAKNKPITNAPTTDMGIYSGGIVGSYLTGTNNIVCCISSLNIGNNNGGICNIISGGTTNIIGCITYSNVVIPTGSSSYSIAGICYAYDPKANDNVGFNLNISYCYTYPANTINTSANYSGIVYCDPSNNNITLIGGSSTATLPSSKQTVILLDHCYGYYYSGGKLRSFIDNYGSSLTSVDGIKCATINSQSTVLPSALTTNDTNGYSAYFSCPLTTSTPLYPILINFTQFPWGGYTAFNTVPQLALNFQDYIQTSAFLSSTSKDITNAIKSNKIYDITFNTSTSTYILNNDLTFAGISEFHISLQNNEIFDGQYYSIKFTDTYSNPITCSGIFYICSTGSAQFSQIKNLNVYSNVTDGCGGIAQLPANSITYSIASYTIIYNCNHYGNIYGNGGGIFGQYAGSWYGITLIDICTSHVDNIGIPNINAVITTSGGGICGSFAGYVGSTGSCTITSCNVNQYTTLNSTYAINTYGGGICGSSSNCVNINNCNVTNAQIKSYAGGIIGNSCTNISVNNCTVNNSLLSGTSMGGICGSNASGLSITNCLFTNVPSYQTTNLSLSGGGYICGDSCANVTISTCYSDGDIINTQMGGICGVDCSPITIDSCYTSGNIIGNYSGGICGGSTTYYSISISNCYSLGTISGKNAGGMCGQIVAQNSQLGSQTLNLTNCISYSGLTGTSSQHLAVIYSPTSTQSHPPLDQPTVKNSYIGNTGNSNSNNTVVYTPDGSNFYVVIGTIDVLPTMPLNTPDYFNLHSGGTDPLFYSPYTMWTYDSGSYPYLNVFTQSPFSDQTQYVGTGTMYTTPPNLNFTKSISTCTKNGDISSDIKNGYYPNEITYISAIKTYFLLQNISWGSGVQYTFINDTNTTVPIQGTDKYIKLHQNEVFNGFGFSITVGTQLNMCSHGIFAVDVSSAKFCNILDRSPIYHPNSSSSIEPKYESFLSSLYYMNNMPIYSPNVYDLGNGLLNGYGTQMPNGFTGGYTGSSLGQIVSGIINSSSTPVQVISDVVPIVQNLNVYSDVVRYCGGIMRSNQRAFHIYACNHYGYIGEGAGGIYGTNNPNADFNYNKINDPNLKINDPSLGISNPKYPQFDIDYEQNIESLYSPQPSYSNFYQVITNCVTYGDIGDYGGGICGRWMCSNQICGAANSPALPKYKNSTLYFQDGDIVGLFPQLVITCCATYGNIGRAGGGIIGSESSNMGVFITGCYSYGDIGATSGGICGSYFMPTPNSIIQSCYSLGSIGLAGGGICGRGTCNKNGSACQIFTCASYGVIGNFAGGILGFHSGANKSTSKMLQGGTYVNQFSQFIQLTNMFGDINNIGTTGTAVGGGKGISTVASVSTNKLVLTDQVELFLNGIYINGCIVNDSGDTTILGTSTSTSICYIAQEITNTFYDTTYGPNIYVINCMLTQPINNSIIEKTNTTAITNFNAFEQSIGIVNGTKLINFTTALINVNGQSSSLQCNYINQTANMVDFSYILCLYVQKIASSYAVSLPYSYLQPLVDQSIFNVPTVSSSATGSSFFSQIVNPYAISLNQLPQFEYLLGYQILPSSNNLSPLQYYTAVVLNNSSTTIYAYAYSSDIFSTLSGNYITIGTYVPTSSLSCHGLGFQLFSTQSSKLLTNYQHLTTNYTQLSDMDNMINSINIIANDCHSKSIHVYTIAENFLSTIINSTQSGNMLYGSTGTGMTGYFGDTQLIKNQLYNALNTHVNNNNNNNNVTLYMAFVKNAMMLLPLINSVNGSTGNSYMAINYNHYTNGHGLEYNNHLSYTTNDFVDAMNFGKYQQYYGFTGNFTYTGGLSSNFITETTQMFYMMIDSYIFNELQSVMSQNYLGTFYNAIIGFLHQMFVFSGISDTNNSYSISYFNAYHNYHVSSTSISNFTQIVNNQQSIGYIINNIQRSFINNINIISTGSTYTALDDYLNVLNTSYTVNSIEYNGYIDYLQQLPIGGNPDIGNVINETLYIGNSLFPSDSQLFVAGCNIFAIMCIAGINNSLEHKPLVDTLKNQFRYNINNINLTTYDISGNLIYNNFHTITDEHSTTRVLPMDMLNSQVFNLMLPLVQHTNYSSPTNINLFNSNLNQTETPAYVFNSVAQLIYTYNSYNLPFDILSFDNVCIAIGNYIMMLYCATINGNFLLQQVTKYISTLTLQLSDSAIFAQMISTLNVLNIITICGNIKSMLVYNSDTVLQTYVFQLLQIFNIYSMAQDYLSTVYIGLSNNYTMDTMGSFLSIDGNPFLQSDVNFPVSRFDLSVSEVNTQFSQGGFVFYLNFIYLSAPTTVGTVLTAINANLSNGIVANYPTMLNDNYFPKTMWPKPMTLVGSNAQVLYNLINNSLLTVLQQIPQSSTNDGSLLNTYLTGILQPFILGFKQQDDDFNTIIYDVTYIFNFNLSVYCADLSQYNLGVTNRTLVTGVTGFSQLVSNINTNLCTYYCGSQMNIPYMANVFATSMSSSFNGVSNTWISYSSFSTDTSTNNEPLATSFYNTYISHMVCGNIARNMGNLFANMATYAVSAFIDISNIGAYTSNLGQINNNIINDIGYFNDYTSSIINQMYVSISTINSTISNFGYNDTVNNYLLDFNNVLATIDLNCQNLFNYPDILYQNLIYTMFDPTTGIYEFSPMLGANVCGYMASTMFTYIEHYLRGNQSTLSFILNGTELNINASISLANQLSYGDTFENTPTMQDYTNSLMNAYFNNTTGIYNFSIENQVYSLYNTGNNDYKINYNNLYNSVVPNGYSQNSLVQNSIDAYLSDNPPNVIGDNYVYTSYNVVKCLIKYVTNKNILSIDERINLNKFSRSYKYVYLPSVLDTSPEPNLFITDSNNHLLETSYGVYNIKNGNFGDGMGINAFNYTHPLLFALETIETIVAKTILYMIYNQKTTMSTMLEFTRLPNPIYESIDSVIANRTLIADANNPLRGTLGYQAHTQSLLYDAPNIANRQNFFDHIYEVVDGPYERVPLTYDDTFHLYTPVADTGLYATVVDNGVRADSLLPKIPNGGQLAPVQKLPVAEGEIYASIGNSVGVPSGDSNGKYVNPSLVLGITTREIVSTDPIDLSQLAREAEQLLLASTDTYSRWNTRQSVLRKFINNLKGTTNLSDVKINILAFNYLDALVRDYSSTLIPYIMEIVFNRTPIAFRPVGQPVQRLDGSWEIIVNDDDEIFPRIVRLSESPYSLPLTNPQLDVPAELIPENPYDDVPVGYGSIKGSPKPSPLTTLDGHYMTMTTPAKGPSVLVYEDMSKSDYGWINRSKPVPTPPELPQRSRTAITVDVFNQPPPKPTPDPKGVVPEGSIVPVKSLRLVHFWGSSIGNLVVSSILAGVFCTTALPSDKASIIGITIGSFIGGFALSHAVEWVVVKFLSRALLALITSETVLMAIPVVGTIAAIILDVFVLLYCLGIFNPQPTPFYLYNYLSYACSDMLAFDSNLTTVSGITDDSIILTSSSYTINNVVSSDILPANGPGFRIQMAHYKDCTYGSENSITAYLLLPALNRKLF